MAAKLRLHAAPATLVFLAVILALVVTGVVTLSGAEAASKQPKCGDKITADTTLHHDLVDCPNKGIVIGADGITLDLNGHTIDGDGAPAIGCDPRKRFCDAGVLSSRHDGVTVMNGSVREFFAGTVLNGARHARVVGISASRNELAGIFILRCVRSLVRDSSGNGSITPDGGTGIYLIASHHVRILDNSFRDNGDRGMGVFDSTDNLIKGNLFSRYNAAAIVLEGSDRNQVRRNRSIRDGTGVFVARGNRNVIAGNRIARAITGRGGDGQGIEVPRGDHNLIARNSIRGTSGHGIGLGFDEGVGNVVRRNHVRGAGRFVGERARHRFWDGVHLAAKAKHTLIRRNRARRSEDDGIEAESRTTKLTRNRAARNADLGIEAVRGVIDGGGNVAHHKGDPRQCTHIACS